MHVDLYFLRHQGVRLSPDAIKAQTPLRGRLSFYKHLDGQPTHTAVLHDDAGKELADLCCAHIAKISDGILIAGFERYWGTANGPANGLTRRQAWWCTVAQ